MERSRSMIIRTQEMTYGISGLIVALIVFACHLITEAGAGSTAQRDAPTTRFYTPDGKSAGTASTYGNTTKYYAPDGKLTGSATRNNR
jgi:hypothetical protein